MAFPRAASDPFSPTADPSAYVARTATEAVLVRLESALADGSRVLLLEGPPGAGKTTLLHVLARRVDGRFQPVHLPYPKLSPEEFCQWALAVLNEPAGGDPGAALSRRLARDGSLGFPPLLWMVDDAGWMPLDTLRRLLDLQRDLRQAMRTLLVVSDRFPARLLEGAGLGCAHVSLSGRMDRAETGRYLRARLEGHLDDRSRQRVEAALDQLYRQSDGNPARLHAAATLLLSRSPRGSCANQGDPP